MVYLYPGTSGINSQICGMIKRFGYTIPKKGDGRALLQVLIFQPSTPTDEQK